MKNLIVAFLLICMTLLVQGQHNNLSNTVVDGGGKTYSSKVTGSNLNNVTFQNFNFTGEGGFEFISGSLNGVKIINNKASNINRFISVGSVWGGTPVISNNFEIANNEITNAKGYVFHLHGAQNLNVHHNRVVGTTQGGDGGHPGVYFVNLSNGQFHHNWIEGAYGNGFRVWGDATSTSRATIKIYNSVVVGSSKYSAVEANGNYNTRDFDLTINNCVFGNLAAGGYISSGLTMYDLAPNTASITNTKVFNVSNGAIFSNEGGTPSSTAGSAYYASLSEAGFSSTSTIRLPDGSAWNDGSSTTPPPPPPNLPPTVIADVDKTIQLPVNSITLKSDAKDPENGALTYSWTKVSTLTATFSNTTGPEVSITNLVAGTHTFRVAVKDDKGAVATDDVMVTVLPALPPVTEKKLIFSLNFFGQVINFYDDKTWEPAK